VSGEWHKTSAEDTGGGFSMAQGGYHGRVNRFMSLTENRAQIIGSFNFKSTMLPHWIRNFYVPWQPRLTAFSLQAASIQIEINFLSVRMYIFLGRDQNLLRVTVIMLKSPCLKSLPFPLKHSPSYHNPFPRTRMPGAPRRRRPSSATNTFNSIYHGSWVQPEPVR
jgi:hypothetical protein